MKNKLLLGLGLCSLLTLGNLTLNSCKGNPTSQKDETTELLEAALNALSVPGEVSDNFELTVNAVGGVKITWTSSNTNVIKIDGNLATVTQSTESDVNVTLTAVAKKDDRSSSPKEFTVKVLKKEAVSLPEGVISIKEAKESAVDTSVTVSGVVTSFVGGVNKTSGAYSPNGFYLTDATETIYVYGYMVANQVEMGDLICITGPIALYGGAVQISKPTLYGDQAIAKNQKAADPTSYAVSGKTIAEVKDPTTNPGLAGKTYIFECYIGKHSGASYTNYQISDTLPSTADNRMNIYSSASDLHCPECSYLDSYVTSQEKVKVAYYINSTNSAGTQYRGNIIYIF